jgi:hypothetical protein
VVLHGYSGNSFGGLPSAIGASIYANDHQLRSGIALGHYEFTIQNQSLVDTPPPLIQLPAPLFIGSTSIRGASTHCGNGDPPRWGDAPAGPALQRPGRVAVAASRHQP